MRTRLVAPVVLSVAILTLAGCGDDEADSEAEGPSAPAQSSQACPGELAADGAGTVDSDSGAPLFVDGQYAAVVDDVLLLGADQPAPSKITHSGLSLEGTVDDDLLISFNGDDGTTVQRVTTAGETVWEALSTAGIGSASYDSAEGWVEVRAGDDEDAYYSADDGSEVDAPEESLSDLTLQDGDQGLVLLEQSDVLSLWGDLSFDGNERYVVTDRDQADQRELTMDEKFIAEACGSDIYTLVPGSAELAVFDGSGDLQESTRTVSLPGPSAESEPALAVGEGYVSVRAEDDTWYVVTP